MDDSEKQVSDNPAKKRSIAMTAGIASVVVLLAVIIGVISYVNHGQNANEENDTALAEDPANGGVTAVMPDADGMQAADSRHQSGSQNQTDSQGSEEPIVLTVYDRLSSYRGEQGGWGAQFLLQKFHVVLNFVPNLDWEEGMSIEEGNVGDILMISTTGMDYQEMIEAGLLYDWESGNLLQEHGAYIETHMAAALAHNRELNGGTVYGVGVGAAASIKEAEDIIYTWDIRWDLYRELGYPKYRTLDELVEVLAAMKALCPQDEDGGPTYGLALWSEWDRDMMARVKEIASAYYGYDGFLLGLYDAETGDFYDALHADGPYLTCLKFLNDLYQAGLIEPEARYDSQADVYNKMAAGGYFLSIEDWRGSDIYNPAHEDGATGMYSLAPGDASPAAYGLSTLGNQRIFAIGANTEYPELCMEVINWLATPEGTMTYHYGPQGVCWEYDAGGHPYFTEFGREAFYFDSTVQMTGDYEGCGAFIDGMLQFVQIPRSFYSYNPETAGERYDWRSWPSNIPEVQGEAEADWRAYVGADTAQENFMNRGNYRVIPASEYEEPVLGAEDEALILELSELISEYSWQAVYAQTDEEFEALIANLRTEADGLGYAHGVSLSKEQAALRREAELAVLSEE